MDNELYFDIKIKSTRSFYDYALNRHWEILVLSIKLNYGNSAKTLHFYNNFFVDAFMYNKSILLS